MRGKYSVPTLCFLFLLFALEQFILFIIPVVRDNVFWMNWSFLTISFLIICFLAFSPTGLRFQHSSVIPSVILSIASFAYLGLSFAVTLIFSLSPLRSMRFSILVQVLILGAFCFAMIITYVMRRAVESDDKEIQKAVSGKLALESAVQGLIDRSSVPAHKAELKKLMSEVRYSDPMTPASLIDLDREISDQIKKLGETMEDASIAISTPVTGIISLIRQRNRSIQSLK